jgi:hypothetical protein
MVQHRAAACQPRHAGFVENVDAFSPTCAGIPLEAPRKDENFTKFAGYARLERNGLADWADGPAPMPRELTDAARCGLCAGVSR